MFLACPADMLANLWLKTGRLLVVGKCPSQVGYVYDRRVSFRLQLVCVDSLSGGGVLILNQDRMTNFQDKTVTGQDGKCDGQAVKIYDRTVSRWWNHSPDTESWRVGDISNMFDIWSIHHDKLRYYIRS